MNNAKDTKNQKEKTFPASVVKIITDDKVVINRGTRHNIKEGQRFLLYSLSEEEIKDPVSGKSLGYLETVKGTGKITHVQEQMSTIESDKIEAPERKIIKKTSVGLFFPMRTESEEETITPSKKIEPFDNPQEGDKVKPI